MRRALGILFLTLIVLNGVAAALAGLLLVMVVGAQIGWFPEPASWPQHLTLDNASEQPVKVTPIAALDDGAWRPARLHENDEERRVIDPPGALPLEPGASRTFIYDREKGGIVAVVVEDVHGRIAYLPVPAVEPDVHAQASIPELSSLEPVPPHGVEAFKRAQEGGRIPFSIAWLILPCLTFVILLQVWLSARRRRVASAADGARTIQKC